MNDVMVIGFSLAVVVLFISIAIFVRLYRQEKITKQRLEKKLHAMDVLAKNARIQHEALVNQFKELRAGSIGMSHKLAELVNRFDYLMDRQNQVEMLDPDGRLYR